MRTIHRYKQWEIRVNDETGEYEIVNLNPDPSEVPQRQYFRAFSGKYGEPIIEPEPDLALPIPTGVQYADQRGDPLLPDQKISGLICRDMDGATAMSADGKVSLRLSLTNALSKNIVYQMAEDGTLKIGGRCFHLQILVMKDKKRFRNYDAYFGHVKPEAVLCLELEDLIPLPSAFVAT